MVNKINTLIKGEVQTHKDLSANVLNIFTQTIDKLKKINENINISIVSKEVKISILTSENMELKDIQKSNNKIVDKLSSIFND